MIMLSPLGDLPHAKGLQRIDAEAVRQLVDDFSSLPARLGRLFVGVPFYIGHPDVPGLENEYPDKNAYGWVTALAQESDGLYATVKWSKAGAEMIAERHYRFLSPHWSARPVVHSGGRMIYRPARLLSVGLTNNPNLPVLPLPLENAARSGAVAAVHWVGQVVALGGLGEETREETEGTKEIECTEAVGNEEFQKVEITNEPEEEINMNQNEQNERAAAGENRVAALNIEAVLSLLGLPVTATLDEVKKRVETQPIDGVAVNEANDVLQNERARADWPAVETRMQKLEERLINSVVDQAIREGRTTAAQRGYWSAQLAEDFDGKSAELANVVPVVKTERRANDFKSEAERHSERASASSEVLRLVKMKTDQGLDYDRAWCAVKDEHQNLFTLMQQPERE
jgi:phage I-like protein